MLHVSVRTSTSQLSIVSYCRCHILQTVTTKVRIFREHWLHIHKLYITSLVKLSIIVMCVVWSTWCILFYSCFTVTSSEHLQYVFFRHLTHYFLFHYTVKINLWAWVHLKYGLHNKNISICNTTHNTHILKESMQCTVNSTQWASTGTSVHKVIQLDIHPA